LKKRARIASKKKKKGEKTKEIKKFTKKKLPINVKGNKLKKQGNRGKKGA